jgi:hypothetical protein
MGVGEGGVGGGRGMRDAKKIGGGGGGLCLSRAGWRRRGVQVSGNLGLAGCNFLSL